MPRPSFARCLRRGSGAGTMRAMGEGIYILAGLMLGVLGFLWTIHRDMRNLSERAAKDNKDLSERLTKDMNELSARVSADLRGLSDRVARLEGLLEGSIRRREPAPDAGE